MMESLVCHKGNEVVCQKRRAFVKKTCAETEYYHFSRRNLHLISDGSHIPLGRKYVQCILTPGHTAGSVCYLFQKWLFTGDTLFAEGCGWCRSLGGDAEAIFESVQRLKRLIDNNVKIYPAHSYGQEVGKTMEFLLMNNIYMVIEEKRSLWNSEIGKDKIICLDFNKKQNLRERIGKAHERYCLFVFRPGITVF